MAETDFERRSDRYKAWYLTRATSLAGLFSLHHFNRGETVAIDLKGIQDFGAPLFERALLKGIIVEPRNCLVQVTGISFTRMGKPDISYTGMDEVKGRIIGLSVKAAVPTPVGSQETIVYSTLQENGQAAYYLLDELAEAERTGRPDSERLYWPLARYAGLMVGGEALFGEVRRSRPFDNQPDVKVV